MAVLTTVATLATSREAAAGDTSLPQTHGSVAASPDRDDLGTHTFHEVTATPFLDPVSKSQVVMVVQTVGMVRRGNGGYGTP